VRTLAVVCPTWPLVAAGIDPATPAMVVRANRVLALTPAARAEGLTIGLRRRQAHAICPAAVVVPDDPTRDARAFEAVLCALGTLTPKVEATRPGLCSFATRGPSRFHGGDEALAERAAAMVLGSLTATRNVAGDAVDGDRGGGAGGAPVGRGDRAGGGGSSGGDWAGGGGLGGGVVPVGVGIADGPFAAELAARRAVGRAPLVVPPGASPAFLAPLGLDTLRVAGAGGDPELIELVDVLGRLGLRTLGAFAELASDVVLARFGPTGRWAHRLAAGLDPRPLAARQPPLDLTVRVELDPPAERIDRVAFAAKRLADELHAGLAERGLACSRVVIAAETEHGEQLERCWRHEGLLGAAAVADRVRWQLDSWLNGPPAVRPTSGITSLTLVPADVAAATGRQPGFWGGDRLADARVARAVARLGALLGDEAVRVAEPRGARDPLQQVATVPAAAAGDARDPTRAPPGGEPPWPGRLPEPSPAAVPSAPEAVEVLDAEGRAVEIDHRGAVSAPPALLRTTSGAPAREVVAWAGPWPADERWWDPVAHRRRARFQVVLNDGTATLVTREAGRWWLEALYE
jgi:protein ImuB